MPAVRASVERERRRVLHERDALPLDRVGDERLAASRRPHESARRRRAATRDRAHRTTRPPIRTRAASSRDRRARGSPPSACRTAARCDRRRSRDRRAGRVRQPGAPPSSGPPAARRRRSSRRRRRRDAACRFAHAMPRPLEMPMPSEPEFASIPGTPTSGCPSRPPSRRSRASRSAGSTPSP